jgi:hypothetical protein
MLSIMMASKILKKTDFKETLLVFLVVLIAYGYFFTESDANTNSRLALVKAIVEENRFEIDSFHDSTLLTSDKAFYNGHYYSDKAPGSSLIGVPVYYLILRVKFWLHTTLPLIVFRQLLTFFVISLISAILALMIYSFTKRITDNYWYSLLITVGICLGTPYYAYSTTYYGHTLAGLFLFIAFYIWFEARCKNKIGPVMAIASGFFLGAAVFTEYPTLLIVVIIGSYIVYILWKLKHLLDWKIYVLFIAGALIPLLLLMYYNYSIFKNPFDTGYSHESDSEFSSAHNTGLMGISLPNLNVLFNMTFHTTMGIFWQSPILLLAFAGWFTARKNPDYYPEAIFSFIAILLYFVVFSGYHTWWGGLAFTPRHLIPILPFFSIPLALLPKHIQKAMILPTLFSIGQMFIVTAASRHGLNSITDFKSHFYRMFENSTIYSIYFPNFLSQLLSTNRGQQFFGLEGYKSLAPLFIVEAILLIIFLVLMRSPKKSFN